MTLDELAHVVQAAFDDAHVDKDQAPCIGCTAAARAVLLAVADYLESITDPYYGCELPEVELRRIAGEGEK